MNPLISVIVAVYNVEAYLDKCVRSILDQTYTNLEVILVDDGSTDRSCNMCDDYACVDRRIKVIHQVNGGQSSARNAGLEACCGEYISFVDGDDWIEADMYSTLLEQLDKFNADLAICGRYDGDEQSNKTRIGKRLGKNGLFDAYQILPQMMIGQLSDFSVCDKLHRRSLWENVRFPEGEIYEDLAVMYKVVIAAKTVVLCDEPLYVYRHRKGSTLTAGFREALTDYPKQTRQLILDINSWYPEYTNYAVWSHMQAIYFVMIKLLRTDRKTYSAYKHLYDIYIQDVKKWSCVWRKDSLFTRSDRLKGEILLHKRLARLIVRLKAIIKRGAHAS